MFRFPVEAVLGVSSALKLGLTPLHLKGPLPEAFQKSFKIWRLRGNFVGFPKGSFKGWVGAYGSIRARNHRLRDHVGIPGIHYFWRKLVRPFASGKACPVQHLAVTSNSSVYIHTI